MQRPKILLLVLGLALLAACAEESTVPTQKDLLAERNVDQVLYGLEHVVTSKGVRKAVLRGDSAYFRDTDSRVDLRGVKLEFFNETTGVTSGTLASRTGEYDMRTGSMIARGSAVLTLQGPPNRTIVSEELHYDVQGDRVWSDRPTVMKENGREVRGNSFTSDTKFQNVTVQSAKVSGPNPAGSGGQVRF